MRWCVYLTHLDGNPDLSLVCSSGRILGSGCQGMIHSHHSFLGTLAVGDSCVALQILDADLLTGRIKAASDWAGNGI